MSELSRQWCDTVMEELAKAELRQHHAAIDALIEKNNARLGARHAGFNYLGDGYGYGGNYAVHVPMLEKEFEPELVQLLGFRNAVVRDMALIKQLLVKLLRPCESVHAIRNALPECLVSLNPTLAAYQRTAPPAGTIRDSPRDLRQYEKLLPRIEMYCAVRLIY